MRQTLNNLIVCGSTPLTASMSMMAESAAASVRYVSSLKSLWPGVSRRFISHPAHSKCMTDVEMEMPRSCSMAIQSLVAWRALLRALTDPASWTAPP